MSNNLLNILLADDDEEDLELIEEAILHLEPGARLHKVTNGKAAIDYLDHQQDDELPCLIILDYSMPHLNGAQVLARISHQPRYLNIPKIVLSTSDAPVHIHECKTSGATEYFVKPNTKQGLDLMAEKILSFCNLN